MNLTAVMRDIGTRLQVIEGLNVHDFPVGNVNAPAALLSYPERIEFHGTYQNGMARIDLPLVVVAGRANEESARDLLGDYCAGSGVRSIKGVLESGAYIAFDDITVTSADFDVVDIAGKSYIAALFDLDIAGTGA